MLTEESKGRIRALCNEIAKEKNPERFSQLLRELNQVFDSTDLSVAATADAERSPATKK